MRAKGHDGHTSGKIKMPLFVLLAQAGLKSKNKDSNIRNHAQ